MRGYQHRFDAVIELFGKQVVHIGHFFKRHAVRDDFAGLDASGLDVLDQLGQVTLDADLIHLQCQSLVHRTANRNRIERPAIHADDGLFSAFAH